MQITSFSDFRNHAAEYITAVEEKGARLIVTRHGKPVAEIIPIQKHKKPTWKRSPQQLSVKGLVFSAEILSDRNE